MRPTRRGGAAVGSAVVVPGDADVAEAVSRLEAVRAVPSLEGAALAIDGAHVPADEAEEAPDLEDLAKGLASYTTRTLRTEP